ncbi:hypothetical protein L1987_87998 [Smallanthus sonchifolius]|nr:hypothetical protein L1987_89919 [Smallanthus sonchifolius]KAI3664375.1 hypothetical protein L1987_89882 [Smallanthus sonchifolius]KAI3664673.1 hypothetical protein L1987_89560 [Smallanthus sonchifolius]KAI3666348.1 hypothetical protein L1987_89154 [Smallanthus sonchifolius]KAI3666612.1 hypothetical protein L1987_88859 [Smallanthus sonchifolius]
MTAYAVYMAITYLYRVGGRSLARLLARVSGLPAFGPIFYYSGKTVVYCNRRKESRPIFMIRPSLRSLFLCGFLYRDPAGTVLRFQQVREGPAMGMLYAAQKPYSSTGAGLVLRGSNSKWYQEGAIVTARHRNRLSRQLPSQPVSKQRGRVNGPRVLVQRRLSPFQQRGRGELAQGIQMGDSRSDDCRSSDSENRILSPPTKPGLFRIALIQCQPLVKDLHGAEPFSPTCFGESLIRTKLVGVASSKQLPLAPIDEKEIELEKSKEDFDPRSCEAVVGIESSWQRARRPQLETGRLSLFHEDVIFKIGFLVVNQSERLASRLLVTTQTEQLTLLCWGGNPIDVSQEGSDEVGDCRLSFLRFGYEVSFEALDKGAIEILGPYGISYTFRRLAERISQLQSGFVVRRVRYDPWPPAWILGEAVSGDSPAESRMRGDPHVRQVKNHNRTGGACQDGLKIAGRIEIRSFVRNKVAIGRTCGWIESYALKFFKSGFMDKPSAKRRRNAISEVSWLFRARAKRARSDPSWKERVEVAKSGIGCTNSTDRRPSRCLWGRTDRLISSRDRRSTLANATREEAAKIPSLTNAPA